MNMCEGPVLVKFLKFSLPIAAAGILQLMFNAADTMVVGNFGSENALAAVSSTGIVAGLLTDLFMGITTSANVLASRFKGAGDNKKVSRVVHTSMLFSLVSGIALMLVGILFAPKILQLMNIPDNILPLSSLYIKIYFLGVPASFIYNFGNALMRSMGDTKRPLYYLTFAGIINVGLNLIMVLVFRLDVAGVAIATAVSQCVSAFLIVRCLMKETGAFKLDLKKLCFDKAITAEMLRIGIPAGLQASVFSLAGAVVQSSINSFGEITMAVCAASRTTEGFINVTLSSFARGTITFMSENVGAGKYSRLNKILWISSVSTAVICIAMGGTVAIFYEFFVGIYDSRPEVLAAAYYRTPLICSLYFICGLMECFAQAQRGLGAAIAPTIVTIIGVCGIRFLWIALVMPIPQFHNEFVLYLCFPISWTVTFIAHFINYNILRRRLPREDVPLCDIKTQ